MKAGRLNRRRISYSQRQRGVVLLIALIMLVAMTLAGIGMMRSVDTGSVIAGNMAFKQATLNASDAGTSTGFNNVLGVLANSSNSIDKTLLNFNNGQPCPAGATAARCSGGNINVPGYFSTPINPCEVTGQTAGNVNGTACTATQSAWWTNSANWANAATLPPITDPSNGSTIATVSYLVHRMCQSPNAAPSATLIAGQLCQTYTAPATGCSKTQLLPCTSTSVFYRVTSRSVGVRNTTTYTQTLVLIGL